ncbi:MAG: tetratricopeptide repeat-containing protein, partial [Rhodoplanes sp.]
TVGLWGAVHKRLWDHGKNVADLNLAIRAYARGYLIMNDHYNGINFAFLSDTRASITTGDESIADRTVANRIRREVLARCEELLAQDVLQGDEAFWVLATKVEALVGLGHEDADRELVKAAETAPQAWMAETMLQQIAALKALRQ